MDWLLSFQGKMSLKEIYLPFPVLSQLAGGPSRVAPAARRMPDFSRGLWDMIHHPGIPARASVSLCPEGKSDWTHSTGKCIQQADYPCPSHHLHGQGHSYPLLMVSIKGKTCPGWKHVFAHFNLLADTQVDLRLSSKALWHLVCQLKHPLQERCAFMDISTFWSFHLFFSSLLWNMFALTLGDFRELWNNFLSRKYTL